MAGENDFGMRAFLDLVHTSGGFDLQEHVALDIDTRLLLRDAVDLGFVTCQEVAGQGVRFITTDRGQAEIARCPKAADIREQAEAARS